MSIGYNENSFLVNNKSFFPYSGEVQYFRIKKQYWRTHLRNLKEANLNTVTTYIPWDFHEYEEGKFDLTGETVPERDIEGFIKLCQEFDLYLCVKPGPYIVGEYKNQGIPQWLTDNYPETIAKRVSGEPFPSYVLTYMHPIYLKLSMLWFDKIMPLIVKYQLSSGGSIAFLQVCNEVGMNFWLAGEGDYSKTSIEYYRKFLKQKYAHINELNKLYATKYKQFSEIKKVPFGSGHTKQEFLMYRDWHDFYRWYYAEYLDFLITEIKKRGVNVQLNHNVPGWIYSRGTEFPLNITMYTEIFKKHPDVIFGVDHIPENVSFRNFHDDFICNEILYSMQERKKPVFIAELQAGSREHSVRTYPNEMELFYKASLANDIKGFNFYMFSQGKNPEGKGALGPMFYWETVLANDGSKNKLYDPVKRLGAWIKANEVNLLESKRKTDLSVGFYRPYYQTEFLYPFPSTTCKLDLTKMGLKYDPKNTMTNVYFEGVLKVLKMLNYHYDINDLEKTPFESLCKYKQLWVVALDYMDRETQQKLLAYVEAGGTLIVSPTLPSKDLDLKPCSILKEGLNINELKTIKVCEPKISFYQQKDISCNSQITLYKPNQGQVGVAYLDDSSCCGLESKIGKGKAIILGTSLGYGIAEHLLAYQKLLAQDKLSKPLKIDNEYLTVIPRYMADGAAFLFILNYHRLSETANIEFTLNGKKIVIKNLFVGATQGLILPVNMPITKTDCVVNYSTLELFNCSGNDKQLTLKLFGYHGPVGEISIASKKKPKQVSLSGEKLLFVYKNKTIIIAVPKRSKMEILNIIF